MKGPVLCIFVIAALHWWQQCDAAYMKFGLTPQQAGTVKKAFIKDMDKKATDWVKQNHADNYVLSFCKGYGRLLVYYRWNSYSGYVIEYIQKHVKGRKANLYDYEKCGKKMATYINLSRQFKFIKYARPIMSNEMKKLLKTDPYHIKYRGW